MLLIVTDLTAPKLLMGRFLDDKLRGADFLCHLCGQDEGKKEKAEVIVFRTLCFKSDPRNLPAIDFASPAALSLKTLIPAPSCHPMWGDNGPQMSQE